MARYKKQDRTCEVVEAENGPRFRLDDGTEYASPSSAGRAAMSGIACNGRRFWSLEADAKPRREPKAKAEKRVKASKKPARPGAAVPAAKKPSAKKPAAKKAKKSDSYGCGVCSEVFPTTKDATAHAMEAPNA